MRRMMPMACSMLLIAITVPIYGQPPNDSTEGQMDGNQSNGNKPLIGISTSQRTTGDTTQPKNSDGKPSTDGDNGDQSNTGTKQKQADQKVEQPDFTFSIGGTFDILSDLAASVYFDVDVMRLELDTARNEGWWSHEGRDWSAFGWPTGYRVGFYRGTTPAFFDTIPSRQSYYLPLATPDSAQRITRYLMHAGQRATDIVGLHVSAVRPIAPTVYWSAYLEVYRRFITTTYRDSLILADTLRVDTSDIPDGALSPLNRPNDASLSQRTEWTVLPGLGVLTRFENPSYSVRLQGVLTMPLTLYPDIITPDSPAPNLILRFSIMEKELGFTLGAHLRAALRTSRFEIPDLILYVSKTFDLSHLKDNLQL